MKGKVYFKETQTFKKLIPLILLVLMASAWIFAMYWQIYLENTIGPYPINNLGIILIGIILMIPIILALFLRMETRLGRDGFHYKLRPLEFGWHKIPISKISNYEILKSKKKDTYVLKIQLENKKSISISTKKPEKLKSALLKLIK